MIVGPPYIQFIAVIVSSSKKNGPASDQENGEACLWTTPDTGLACDSARIERGHAHRHVQLRSQLHETASRSAGSRPWNLVETRTRSAAQRIIQLAGSIMQGAHRTDTVE